MNVAIFGGTFDPVHRGHLAVARAAQRAYKLGRIYFVPADLPPHKQRQPITPFYHRYAMLTLALRGEKTFVPSLIEAAAHPSKSGQTATPASAKPALAGDPGGGAPKTRPNYTIDTVRRFRKTIKKGDRLFFIVGIDMFLDIGTWHKPDELLQEVEFIVVSRPGFQLPAPGLRNIPGLAKTGLDRGTRIHVLDGVAENVSSTKVRETLARGRLGKGLLDEAVVDYIRKEHLYISTEY